MQLINRNDDPDQRMSATIYAALIDSLFQMPTPVFAGSILVAFAASLTAWKTGLHALWFCVLLLIASGGLRTIEPGYLNRAHCGLPLIDSHHLTPAPAAPNRPVGWYSRQRCRTR